MLRLLFILIIKFMSNKTYKNETTVLSYFFAGTAIAFADIIAIAHFAHSVVESVILGLLLVPTAVFVTLCASKLRE